MFIIHVYFYPIGLSNEPYVLFILALGGDKLFFLKFLLYTFVFYTLIFKNFIFYMYIVLKEEYQVFWASFLENQTPLT